MKEKEKLVAVVLKISNQEQIDLIDKACEQTMRSRNKFITFATLKHAREVLQNEK
jgi:uncharacterized protein (DUF1778 family)